ncbi:hypothetical protein RND71_009574 [Anisodus tanguticus]|uniref:Uncharacterized protein n=1 Tax=Anisodus tanguticus TaxID=243964 RepID=A0AAE1SIA9_9SOLA|nr:hypothetical protein RND71_009574 [Anisodus tanguticus]
MVVKMVGGVTLAAEVGRNGYRSPSLLHLVRSFPVRRSVTENPNGSKLLETELSVANFQTEIRFLMMFGA